MATRYFRAVRWQPGGMTTDLNGLIPKNSGITLMSPNHVTNQGRIVGVGSTSAGNRAFLLVPGR